MRFADGLTVILVLVLCAGLALHGANRHYYRQVVRSLTQIFRRPLEGIVLAAHYCRPTQVVHSDKSHIGAINGSTNSTVWVTCEEGYIGSGKALCQSTGTFTAVKCRELPPRRIAVATVCIGPAGERMEFVVRHFARYCRRHEYALEVQRTLLDPTRSATWNKVLFISRLLDAYDFVFWMDLDSLFTDPARRIEQAVHRLEALQRDVLVSGDSNVMNAGHMLFRASAWSRAFLRDVYAIHPADFGMGGDNAAFSAYLAGCTPANSSAEWRRCYDRVDRGWHDPGVRLAVQNADMRTIARVLGVPRRVRQHVAWAPQRFMNSYPGPWRPGDWILHFVGGSGDEKVRRLREALERIEPTHGALRHAATPATRPHPGNDTGREPHRQHPP